MVLIMYIQMSFLYGAGQWIKYRLVTGCKTVPADPIFFQIYCLSLAKVSGYVEDLSKQAGRVIEMFPVGRSCTGEHLWLGEACILIDTDASKSTLVVSDISGFRATVSHDIVGCHR